MANIFTTPVIPPSVPEVSTFDLMGRPYTHQVEVELTSGTPRQAHMTPGTVTLRRWLWNILIGIFCVLVFFGRRDIESWDALIKRGVPIIGKVNGRHTTTNKGHTYYHIDYAFNAEQHYCTGSYSTSYDDYYSTLDNSPVTVTYLPGSAGEIWQPGVATTQRREDRLLIWTIVTLGITLSNGLIIVLCNANWKNQLRVLQTGIAVSGVVTEGKVTSGSKGEKYYYLTYRYSVGARPIDKKITVSKQEYEKYTQGNPYLSVLYDSENPEKSLAYFQIKNARLDSLVVSA